MLESRGDIELQPGYIFPPGMPLSKGTKQRTSARWSQMIDYEGSSSFIRKISSFFTPAEQSAWIAFAESVGMERCVQRATRDCAHRRQYRMSFEDRDVASTIFARIEPFLPPKIDNAKPISCASNIRIYRYDVGDSFGAHYDDTNSISISLRGEEHTESVGSSKKKQKRSTKGQGQVGQESVGWTKLTILIYLRGDCPVEGGETLFYKEDGDVFVGFSPADCHGDLLMHGHGHRCLLHEASAVTKGKKYMLRTDVVYV